MGRRGSSLILSRARNLVSLSSSPAEILVEMVRDMQIGGWPAAERIYVFALCWVVVKSGQTGREIITLLRVQSKNYSKDSIKMGMRSGRSSWRGPSKMRLGKM